MSTKKKQQQEENGSKNGSSEHSVSRKSEQEAGPKGPTKRSKASRAGLIFSPAKVKNYINNRVGFNASKGVDVFVIAFAEFNCRRIYENAVYEGYMNPEKKKNENEVTYLDIVDSLKTFQTLRYLGVHLEKMAFPITGLVGRELQQLNAYNPCNYDNLKKKKKKGDDEEDEDEKEQEPSFNSSWADIPHLNFYKLYEKKFPGRPSSSDSPASLASKKHRKSKNTESKKKKKQQNVGGEEEPKAVESTPKSKKRKRSKESDDGENREEVAEDDAPALKKQKKHSSKNADTSSPARENMDDDVNMESLENS